MKKVFTLLAAAVLTLSASATDYTCPLKVTVGGSTEDAGQTVISIDEGTEGTVTLKLKNFTFSGLPVGNITLEAQTVQCGTVTQLGGWDDAATITPGDTPGVDEWMGPSLGEMPILFRGRLAKEKLDAVILINMCTSGLGVIRVDVGNHPEEIGQLTNAGFERFHTATYKGLATYTSDEPDAWHSFMSSTGSLASAVSTATHTFDWTSDVRPGSTGTHAVKIVSTAVLSQSANGTITTGRLNAGSTSAASTNNHAFLDLSNTATDAAGDPFYTTLVDYPDSIAVWVKYHTGARSAKNEKNVNATLAAVITDGTRYQDPASSDQTDEHVVAKASCATIAATDKWQRVVVPFDHETYEDNDIDARGILVTLSTCSVPGGGSTSNSDPDILYVDDIELVYNTQLSELTYKGEPVEGFSPDKYEYDITGDGPFDENSLDFSSMGIGTDELWNTVEVDGAHTTAFILVVGGDMKYSVYTIHYTDRVAAGVEKNEISPNGSPIVNIFDLGGRPVYYLVEPGVYIVKTADGNTYKMVKK